VLEQRKTLIKVERVVLDQPADAISSCPMKPALRYPFKENSLKLLPSPLFKQMEIGAFSEA